MLLARSPIVSPSPMLMRRRRNVVAQAWTPLTLFLAGEQGGWYDPTDLTTMFQDSAGTTPVTAVEQPVGLWLDKRLGALSALGPELSAYAAGFVSAAGITGIGATVSVASGVLTAAAISTDGADRAEIPISGLTVGRTYSVEIVAARGSQGVAQTIRASTALNIPNTPVTTTTATTYQFLVQAIAASGVIRVYAQDAVGAIGDSVLVSSLSVREVPGNHLIQPTSASRPTYSKRYNQLVSTENLASASWANTVGGTGTTPVRTAAYAAAPNGTMTATRLQVSLGGGTTTAAQSYVSQIYAITVDHTYRIWLKSNTASSYVVYVRGSNTEAAVTVTPEWQQFTVSVPSSSSNVWAVGLRGGQATPNSDSADILVWGTDARRTIHTQMGMPAYQRVTTATDYDETGFLPRLRFDGADDSMYSAASVDFTAGDEMTVLAGLTKLSDANAGVVVETSANSGSTAGSFYLAAPVGTSTTAGFRCGGSIPGSLATDGAITAPVTAVLTGLGDISTDTSVLRRNGAQVATSATDQGTGNYGNYVLFVGRRNNASLPLNGDIFQIILRGALTSGAVLTSAEQYVAARTGVTL